jgi:hypothetical protein
MRTKLPVLVAPSFIAPYIDAPGVFSLDHEIDDRLDPAAGQRLVVLANGDVVPAHPSRGSVIDAPSRRIYAGLGSFENTSNGACLSGDPGAYYIVQLRRPLVGRGFFLAMTYSSDDAHRLLASSAGGVETAYNWGETELPAGEDVTVVDRLDATSVLTVNLALQDAASDFCLSRVWVGRLAASVDGRCRTLDDHAAPVGRAASCAGGWD